MDWQVFAKINVLVALEHASARSNRCLYNRLIAVTALYKRLFSQTINL